VPIDPTGKGPKVPPPGAKEGSPVAGKGIDAPPGKGFDKAVSGKDIAGEGTGRPQENPATRFPGLDKVMRVANDLKSGAISSRQEAVTRAVKIMIETRLSRVPKSDLHKAAAEVSKLAREDKVLRERISKLLDKLAEI